MRLNAYHRFRLFQAFAYAAGAAIGCALGYLAFGVPHAP